MLRGDYITFYCSVDATNSSLARPHCRKRHVISSQRELWDRRSEQLAINRRQVDVLRWRQSLGRDMPTQSNAYSLYIFSISFVKLPLDITEINGQMNSNYSALI
jgi:hypothetical protein